MDYQAANVQKVEIVQDIGIQHDTSHQNSSLPYMLSEDFTVWVKDGVVINHRAHGFEARKLPTFNHYLGSDGGYIAVYSHEEKDSIYPASDDIYVIGQVRVQGKYHGRTFIPTGYQVGDNITQDPDLLAICYQYFPGRQGSIWVGGDTGGWFGIQR